ncbi:pre T-cell antigen receptor alpha-like, partial [Clarias magur]
DNMVDVKAAPFSTSPFFHIPLDHGGLTILVCVVNDVLNRDAGMVWLSKATRRSNPASYNVIQKEDAQSTVSVRSLVSMEWDTYTCFISHRSMIPFNARHYYGSRRSKIDFDNNNMEHACSDYESSSNAIQAHTVFLIIQFLRIILVKITIFNVLMTAQAVIK